jgi:hypothetical protein
MEDKYQILVNLNGTHAIIERMDFAGRTTQWKISVPDAGARTTATHICRLLNEENRRDLARRANRDTSET